MEDLRIRKTKGKLKNALVRLAADKAFEDVKVTELCLEANVSRITFYTYYNDKYELMNDCFQDLMRRAEEILSRLQQENNPGGDSFLGYCNLVRAILDLYMEHYEFFSRTGIREGRFIDLLRENYVMPNAERFALQSGMPELNDSCQRTATFLCYGLWGWIHEGRSEHCEWGQLREEAEELLQLLLRKCLPMMPERASLSPELPVFSELLKLPESGGRRPDGKPHAKAAMDSGVF